MWTIFTEAQIDAAARQVFMPLILLINYTLLQYLLFFYWKRRRELRMVLLFATGVLGVACLIPFANPDTDMVTGLNDVSESCCVVTFLIQITVIGHDLNAKFKLKSVMYLTRMAEFLIVVDIAMVFLSFIVTFSPRVMSKALAEDIPNVFENITVTFILFFRFYYIGMSRGWRVILRTRKAELTWYVLFATHEVPFEILTAASGLPWEFAQALWNRITIAGCLFLTANGKIKTNSSKYHTSRVSVAGGDGGGVPQRKRASVTEQTSVMSRKLVAEVVVSTPKAVA